MRLFFSGFRRSACVLILLTRGSRLDCALFPFRMSGPALSSRRAASMRRLPRQSCAACMRGSAPDIAKSAACPHPTTADAKAVSSSTHRRDTSCAHHASGRKGTAAGLSMKWGKRELACLCAQTLSTVPQKAEHTPRPARSSGSFSAPHTTPLAHPTAVRYNGM
jgi:hypothetical protein